MAGRLLWPSSEQIQANFELILVSALKRGGLSYRDVMSVRFYFTVTGSVMLLQAQSMIFRAVDP